MLALTAMQTTHTPLPEAVSALQAATQADRVVTTVNDVGAQAFDARTDGSIVVVDRPDAPGLRLRRPDHRHGDEDGRRRSARRLGTP